MSSGLPESTESFFGREDELQKLRDALNPRNEGRKCVLIHGFGGSGKTQLALQHIHREASRYCAIIWINVSTKETAEYTAFEATSKLHHCWIHDSVLKKPPRGGHSLQYLKARLEDRNRRNWLLVIDSADDGDSEDFSRYIPSCQHGSVLFTSTNPRENFRFRLEGQINLGGLDEESSCALLLKYANRSGDEDGK